MTEKLECTCIEAYKKRNMRDPNCCACSCDHNDLVEQLAKANERVALLERVETIFNDSPELTFEYVKTTFDSELNKFALEQKIEILEELLGRTCPVSGPVVPDKQSRDTLQDHIEQLRKEQEK
jgi:hypothetical protein